jgi:hypothetical protein
MIGSGVIVYVLLWSIQSCAGEHNVASESVATESDCQVQPNGKAGAAYLQRLTSGLLDTTSTATPLKGVDYKKGITYDSMDIASYQVDSQLDCMKKWDLHLGSAAVTYYKEKTGENNCFVKGSLDKETEDSGAETYAQPCFSLPYSCNMLPIPSNYERQAKGCVLANNIKTYKDKKLSECAQICDDDSNCLAFEYGMPYGGSLGKQYGYGPGSCLPQSSTNTSTCDGADYNFDLYFKKKQAK